MRSRHMHVNIQSGIKKARINVRYIDFWRQFPSTGTVVDVNKNSELNGLRINRFFIAHDMTRL